MLLSLSGLVELLSDSRPDLVPTLEVCILLIWFRAMNSSTINLNVPVKFSEFS